MPPLAGGSETAVAAINRKLVRNFIAHLSDAGTARSSIGRKLAAIKALCKCMA